MKTLVITMMTAFAFIAQGFAGTEAKEAIVPPQTLSQWFAGTTVEHMDHANTELYSVKAGKRFFQTDTFSWALWGEVGYADLDYKYDSEFVPVTFNGDVRYNVTDKLSLYAGAGIGIAYASVDSESEWAIQYQTFAGLAYQITPQIEATVGAKYIFADYSDFDNLDEWTWGGGFTWYF